MHQSLTLSGRMSLCNNTHIEKLFARKYHLINYLKMMTFFWIMQILCNNTQKFALTKASVHWNFSTNNCVFESDLVELLGQNTLNTRFFSLKFLCIITQAVLKGLNLAFFRFCVWVVLTFRTTYGMTHNFSICMTAWLEI